MKNLLIIMAATIGMAACSCSGQKTENQPISQEVQEDTCIKATAEELEGIQKALDFYINGGINGDSSITKQGFAETATMSWREGDTLKSVPIQVLYDIIDEGGPAKGGYIISSLNVAEDVAIARIESWLGEAKFADMFTLVKDGDDWKIVSKVYHVK